MPIILKQIGTKFVKGNTFHLFNTVKDVYLGDMTNLRAVSHWEVTYMLQIVVLTIMSEKPRIGRLIIKLMK